jgi:pimeloyl-ACP methyl ester carboxylesterase
MGEAAPALVDEYGLRVLAVDAPGFGGSERLPDDAYRPTALGSSVPQLFDALGLERPVFAGASWGAMVGVFAATAAPERQRALVLVDGAYIDPQTGPDGSLGSLDEVRAYWSEQPGFSFATWEAMIVDARKYFARWSPELERYARSAFRDEDGQVVSIMGTDLFATALWWLEQEPPSAALPALGRTSVPVLLLTATEPAELEARRGEGSTRFAEAVPDAVIRPVPGASHLILEDRPLESARMIGDWLESL